MAARLPRVATVSTENLPDKRIFLSNTLKWAAMALTRPALPAESTTPHYLSSGNRLLEQAALAKYPKRDESNKRQADHILAAFRYQLLHSLDAWVNLRQGE
jgi:hypothetical protein